MQQTNIERRPRPTVAQRRWNLFRETIADYSFSVQESAFIMLHTQGSVSVFVSMINRLYGWKLQRYTGDGRPAMPMAPLPPVAGAAQQCPFFYYRDRVSHLLYLLFSNPACTLNDTQKAYRYDTVLIVQGEGAFGEQQRIFADLVDKAPREVEYGDNLGRLRETLRYRICTKLVIKADYFDFSRCEEPHAKQEEACMDYLDFICLKNTSAKENRKTGGYAKPGRKEDYQKERLQQQVVVAAPQIGLFDDAETVSERQACVTAGNRDIRSSLMDGLPSHVVDMVRYRQLLALQEMGKTILNTLWSTLCN